MAVHFTFHSRSRRARLRRPKWFCCLSPEVLKTFSAESHLGTCPGGAILFVEGQMPRGAFVLCSGKVKLSTTSREGRVLILKMAEPGEALGLSAKCIDLGDTL
jgi:CRP/FNR family cyclic AMP-dependent transcriptional regulator